MDCRKALAAIFLFCDDELEESLRQSLDRHLSSCPHCARRLHQNRKLLIVIRERCVKRAAPTGLRQRILTRIRHQTDWS